MKRRIISGLVFAAVAGVVGGVIAIWQNMDAKLAVIVVVIAIGFVFGLLFQLRAA